jgi:hypothetical protein
MKAYGGVVVQIHVFLTSALVGGEWSAAHRDTHWIGGWVGPRTALDVVEIILDTTGTQTPIPPIPAPSVNIGI